MQTVALLLTYGRITFEFIHTTSGHTTIQNVPTYWTHFEIDETIITIGSQVTHNEVIYQCPFPQHMNMAL
jgi:hypothetical protein